MSEYQYQAIDRPLSGVDRQALRGLATRARITATNSTNEYHWGDLKGDPIRFDLHPYWREVETEIEKRSAGRHDGALALLLDLRALAQEDGTLAEFSDRVRSLRDRHSGKPRFMERLPQVDQQ